VAHAAPSANVAVGAADAAGAAPAEPAPTRLARLLATSTQSKYRLQATGAPFEAKDALKARSYRWDGQQRVWGTTLRSETALQDELAWLKDAVDGGRAVRVRVETVHALQRYSARPGVCTMLAVGDRLDALALVG
jgi:DNA polymerase III subunit epsilon